MFLLIYISLNTNSFTLIYTHIFAHSYIPNLRLLNISSNDMGLKTAQGIATYLSTETSEGGVGYPLRRLLLQNTGIGDRECVPFINAIIDNCNLLELDLSNNKIGTI